VHSSILIGARPHPCRSLRYAAATPQPLVERWMRAEPVRRSAAAASM